jgi:hypothetical protein
MIFIVTLGGVVEELSFSHYVMPHMVDSAHVVIYSFENDCTLDVHPLRITVLLC